MSVNYRLVLGLTLNLGTNLEAENFKKLHDLEFRYPEIDEFTYEDKDRDGKLLLIYDSVCGKFARLVAVDKIINGGTLSEDLNFVELPAPNHVFNSNLIERMSKVYEEYSGKLPSLIDFKYALWSQWY